MGRKIHGVVLVYTGGTFHLRHMAVPLCGERGGTLSLRKRPRRKTLDGEVAYPEKGSIIWQSRKCCHAYALVFLLIKLSLDCS